MRADLERCKRGVVYVPEGRTGGRCAGCPPSGVGDLRGDFERGLARDRYVFRGYALCNDADFRPRSPLGQASVTPTVLAVFLQVLSVGLCYLHDPCGDEAR